MIREFLNRWMENRTAKVHELTLLKRAMLDRSNCPDCGCSAYLASLGDRGLVMTGYWEGDYCEGPFHEAWFERST